MQARTALTPGRFWCALGLAVALAGLAEPTAATTVRRMALPEMVQRADNVVLARALESRVRTDADSLIHYTITVFEVLESAKGPLRPGTTFEVEIMGGEAPGSGWATVVPGAPRFRVREEVVLFTSPREQGRKNLVGFFQGAVRVHDSPQGRVALAPPRAIDPRAGELVTAEPDARRPLGRPPAPGAAPAAPTPRPVAAAARAQVPVAELLQQVRQLHAGNSGRQGERP